jgi:hypothetical protein
VCGIAKYGKDRNAFPKVLLVPPADTKVEDGDEILVLAESNNLPHSIDIGDRNPKYDDKILPKDKLSAKVRYLSVWLNLN